MPIPKTKYSLFAMVLVARLPQVVPGIMLISFLLGIGVEWRNKQNSLNG